MRSTEEEEDDDEETTNDNLKIHDKIEIQKGQTQRSQRSTM
jgi:hypothetical protein